jgi:hypothetical protein
MDFRWVMGITLWTFLSGPIFSGPRELPPVLGRTAAMNPTQGATSSPAPTLPTPPCGEEEKN